MGRPSGTNNNVKSPEEKEKIVLEYLNGGGGYRAVARAHKISERNFLKWISRYIKNGVEGLKSQTGKCATGRPKKSRTRQEELERENLKLRIEIERLKKGYYVKGVGQKKEYISINNRSLKSSKK